MAIPRRHAPRDGAPLVLGADDRALPPGEDVALTLDDIPSPERFLRPSDGKTLAKLEAYRWGTTLATHELREDVAKFVVTYE